MFDYKSMLEAWGFKRISKRGDELVADCPLCGGRQKFYLNTAKAVAVCFKGCFTGSVVSLTTIMEGCSRDEALGRLWEGVGWEAKFKAKMEETEPPELRRTRLEPPHFRPLNEQERNYLLGRNISPSLAEEHGAMGCDDIEGMVSVFLDCSPEEAESLLIGFPERFNYLNNRIVWPIYINDPECGRTLLGYEARSYAGFLPKVLYPRGINSKRTLYEPLTKPKDWAVLVEGVLDQHALEAWGFPSVGSFSAGISQEQAAILLRYSRVYTAYDPDAGGDSGLKSVMEKIGDGTLVYEIKLPRGKDPKACDFYTFNMAFINAKKTNPKLFPKKSR